MKLIVSYLVCLARCIYYYITSRGSYIINPTRASLHAARVPLIICVRAPLGFPRVHSMRIYIYQRLFPHAVRHVRAVGAYISTQCARPIVCPLAAGRCGARFKAFSPMTLHIDVYIRDDLLLHSCARREDAVFARERENRLYIEKKRPRF